MDYDQESEVFAVDFNGMMRLAECIPEGPVRVMMFRTIVMAMTDDDSRDADPADILDRIQEQIQKFGMDKEDVNDWGETLSGFARGLQREDACRWDPRK